MCFDCLSETNKLKLVYFFLVNYAVNAKEQQETDAENFPPSALHCILRHAKKLEGIQATGTSSFTDECLVDIINANCLRNLRRFILTDAAVQHHQGENGPAILDGIGNQQGQVQRFQDNNSIERYEFNLTSPKLTARSVIRLFEICPHLQCTGDLRHWQISAQERRHIFKLIQNRQNQSQLGTTGCLSSNIEHGICASQQIQTLG